MIAVENGIQVINRASLSEQIRNLPKEAIISHYQSKFETLAKVEANFTKQVDIHWNRIYKQINSYYSEKNYPPHFFISNFDGGWKLIQAILMAEYKTIFPSETAEGVALYFPKVALVQQKPDDTYYNLEMKMVEELFHLSAERSIITEKNEKISVEPVNLFSQISALFWEEAAAGLVVYEYLQDLIMNDEGYSEGIRTLLHQKGKSLSEIGTTMVTNNVSQITLPFLWTHLNNTMNDVQFSDSQIAGYIFSQIEKQATLQGITNLRDLLFLARQAEDPHDRNLVELIQAVNTVLWPSAFEQSCRMSFSNDPIASCYYAIKRKTELIL